MKKIIILLFVISITTSPATMAAPNSIDVACGEVTFNEHPDSDGVSPPELFFNFVLHVLRGVIRFIPGDFNGPCN